MPRVEETCLRIDPRLGLQRRDAQRTMDEEDRRERERNQPRIGLPERVDGDTERREHEVGGKELSVEQSGLAEREAARESKHQCEERVVDRDEDDAGEETGDGQPERVVAHREVIENELPADEPGGQRRKQVVKNVERLQVPAVAHLQPLRNHLDDRDEHEEFRRQDERRGNEEHDVGVVRLVRRRTHDEETCHRRRGAEHEEGGPIVRVVEPADERDGHRGRGDRNEREIEFRVQRHPVVATGTRLRRQGNVRRNRAHLVFRRSFFLAPTRGRSQEGIRPKTAATRLAYTEARGGFRPWHPPFGQHSIGSPVRGRNGLG